MYITEISAYVHNLSGSSLLKELIRSGPHPHLLTLDWQDLDISELSSVSLETVLGNLNRHCPNLQDLTIIKNVRASMTVMASLGDNILIPLSRLPDLRNVFLKFDGYMTTFTDEEIIEVVDKLPKLKSFQLISGLAHPRPTIRTLGHLRRDARSLRLSLSFSTGGRNVT